MKTLKNFETNNIENKWAIKEGSEDKRGQRRIVMRLNKGKVDV